MEDIISETLKNVLINVSNECFLEDTYIFPVQSSEMLRLLLRNIG